MSKQISVFPILLIAILLLGLVGYALESENNHDSYYYKKYYGYNSPYRSTSKDTTPVRRRAMTKEEAAALEGTGYKGTRPNSWAEIHALECAQLQCDVCGMHTDNGANSACDYCQSKGYQ